jgi:hypothetical protein
MKGNIFNDDFRDFISALNNSGVEYILVGGYSVILNGYVRTTGDMDIWVNKTKENYKKLLNAFLEFGMPVFDMTEKNFLDNPQIDVFTFGRQPSSIEILTQLKGIEFNEAYKSVQVFEESGLKINFLHINQLIKSKKAVGRFKDLDDIDQLTKKRKK